MKITALIPDEIVDEVKSFSGGKNITESITIALTDWLKIQRIKNLNQKVQKKPLSFSSSFSAKSARELNRKTN